MNNENVKNNNMDEQSCCCPAKVSLMSAIRGIVNPKDECCPLNSFNTDIERKFIDNVENLCIKIKGKFGNISPSFRKDYENILIVYHLSDLDGHGVKLMNAMMNYHESTNTFGCNIRADEAYDEIKKATEEGKQVIIADLNFTKDCAEKVNNELDTSKIVLLDHHETAMYLNDYDWALVVPHSEKENYLSSGSFMFMIYCFIHFNFDNSLYNWDNLMCNIITDVALYDTWFWNSNYDDTREMIKEHFGDHPENLNMFFKIIKRANFVDYIINNIYQCESIMDSEDELKIEIMRIETNKTIFRYYHNMRIVEVNDMKIGVVFGDNECSAVGNYILRANRELSYFIMIDLNKNNIMLRSRNDHNVSTIALDNNGGGHFSAAGFPIEKIEGNQFLFDILGKYNFKLPNIPDKFSINMIKDIAEFDEENKIYKLK